MDTVILSLLQKVQFLSEIESPRIFAHLPEVKVVKRCASFVSFEFTLTVYNQNMRRKEEALCFISWWSMTTRIPENI